MGEQSADIGACFWMVSDETGDELVEALSERIRSDGTSVEVIDGTELLESLSTDELPDDDARADAVSYPIVRLQKHGIVTIIENSRLTPELLSKVDDQLEKTTFLVDPSADTGSFEHTLEVPSGESTGDVVDDLMDYAEERGLFAEGVSDQRSDEEVTDRLKNLGYI